MKTRLAEGIGKEKAAQIYKEMAEAIIHNLSQSGNHRTIIFFDPPEMKSKFESWLGNGYEFIPQEGESLGERMSNAFSKTFSLKVEKAVIIGTDCVEVSDEIISGAFSALDTVDVVLGPAEDGGYYLIGLKTPTAEIFDGIAWSTNLVLGQTLEKLQSKGLNSTLLKTLRDVDTVSDIDDEFLFKIQRRIA